MSEPLEIIGRITSASNATFLCGLGAGADAPRCVYKPVRGERPLWDFPDGTLADREYATYLISEALGWSIVPTTVLRSGPHGPGMVQEWVTAGAREGPDPVDVFPEASVPAGYTGILGALDSSGRPVVLAHATGPRLQTMALFDVIVNNPDRKGGHILTDAGGGVFGVDHGICLHADPKLRTVLWGWAGTAVPTGLLAEVSAFAGMLTPEDPVRQRLDRLLTVREVDALQARVDAVLATGSFPDPSGPHVIPWPPL